MHSYQLAPRALGAFAVAWATFHGSLAWAAAGRTEASYGVSQNGAASYTIPIRATEGINGLTPAIAISYVGPGGDQSRSILGIGFEISGLSYIRPCKRTIVQDGSAGPVTLGASDRYCLDGARLRQITPGATYGASGTQYRLEVDRIVRVTSMETTGNVPKWFNVEMPNGLTYEYGRTADSKLLSGTQTGATPQFWALNKITDESDNSIRFVYDADAATKRFRPISIVYTERGGTAHYEIAFVYQSATQPTASVRFTPATSGSAVHKEDRLLDRIELRHDGAAYRAYKLTYEAGGGSNKRLQKVQECAYAPTEDCLTATVFTWQSPTAGHDALASSGRTVASSVLPLDVNGDGVTDLVWAASGTWRYILGGASGYGSVVNTAVAATNPTKAMVLRWNSDEFDDLLIDWSDGKWRVLRGGASGFNTTVVQAGSPAVASTPAGYTTTVGDLDADGKDDLIQMQLNASLAINVRFNGASGFGGSTVAYSNSALHTKGNSLFIKMTGASAVRKPDFNGDNRVDLLVWGCFWEQELAKCITSERWFQLLSAGSAFVNEGAIPGANYAIQARFGNLNDDDLTDIIYPNTSGAWTVGFGRGSGGFELASGPAHGAYATYQTLVGDYDGDGLDDLYVTKNSPWQWDVFRSNGQGLESTAIPTLISGDGNGWMLLDQNGDLPPDLGRYDNTTLVWSVGAHAGEPGDHLLTATDGLGNKVTFSYLPMSDSAVYVKGSGATAPVQDIEGEQFLVRTLQVSPAGGTSYTLTYKYFTAREHVQGRGYLGMGKREVTDSRKGIFKTETFEQDFPYTGASKSVTVKQSSAGNAKTISSVTRTYAQHVLDSAANNQRYLPYLSGVVTKEYEVGGVRNGALITQTTESNTINTWGNRTSASIDVEDKDSLSSEVGSIYRTELTSTFMEDSGNWCIGLPLTRSERRILPDATEQTRQMEWDVNAAECRVDQETVQPGGGSSLALVTDLEYNGCGLLSSISSYPEGQPAQARETGLIYGSRCQQPTKITNPEGHVTEIVYDLPLYVPNELTDPNGLKTILEHDGFGRLTHESRPDGTGVRFAFANCTSGNSWCGKNSGARLRVTRTERSTSDALLRTDQQYFDGLGRIRWTHTASLGTDPAIVEMVYDASNFMTARTQPYFAGDSIFVTSYEPDLIGRVVEINAPVSEAQPGGRITGFAYEGRNLEITDPMGPVTTRRSNALGQIRAVTDPSPGGVTAYSYHPFGELKSITDAASPGNITSWAINTRGFVTSTTDPDSGTWTYQVNAFGETEKIRDAKTNPPDWTTEFAFDKLGRPVTRDEAEGTTTFYWGKASDNTTSAKYIGRLKRVTSPNYEEIYTFDNKARLKQHRTVIEASNWNFDFTYSPVNGLPEETIYPVSGGAFRVTVKNEYQNNLLKRVVDVNGGTVFWEATAADAWGHYRDVTLGNGVAAFADFDQASGLPDTRTAWSGSTPLVDANVDWDLNGNVAKREDLLHSLAESFTYDNLDRIHTTSLNGGPASPIDIDAIGNITAKDSQNYLYTGNQSGCNYYSHVQPRAVRKAGSTIFCYDKNGNMEKRGGSSISYTSYNLPDVIHSGSNSSTLSYGAWRNRFKQVSVTSLGTETTLYMGGLFERVTRPGGAIEYRHRILGGDGVAAIHTRISGIGTTYYVQTDHLGSPELITNSAGAEVLRLSFTSYGARRNPTTWSGATPAADLTKIADITRVGFTGHEHLDSVGLVHMNGRVYEPAMGRFLSADPIVDGAYSSQGINAYAYVRNNPLRFIDPSGFECALVDNVWQGCLPDTPVHGPRWPDSGLGYDGYAGPIMNELPPHNNRGAKIERSRPSVESQIKDFFCNKAAGDSAANALPDPIENADSIAELANGGAALGAIATGSASGRISALEARRMASVRQLVRQIEPGLKRAGPAGLALNMGLVGLDLYTGNYQSAVYVFLDAIAYAGLTSLTVAGLPTGWGALAGGAAIYSYYYAGGSEGIIQQELCGR